MKRTTRKARRLPAQSPAPVPAPSVEPTRLTASWVDYLTAAIDRSPIPAWAIYSLLFLLVLAVLLGVANAAGTLVDFPLYFLMAGWPVFPLALIHHLDRISGRALDQFRPACDLQPAEVDRLRRDLTTMPAVPTALATLGGIAFILVFYLTNRGLFSAMDESTGETVVGLAVWFSGFAMLGALVYHTVRQLRMVSRVYARVQRLDLFNLSPLYGFAALAARTSIAWAIALYLSLALNPGILESGVAIAAFLAQAALVLGTFAWPLVGIHRRIVKTKELALAEVGDSLNRAIGELNRLTRSMSLARMDGLNKMILSLVASRDVLEKVPTWPWSSGTPVAVGSALLLPVILFIIERVLGNFLGL